jgi:hypothetical protein
MQKFEGRKRERLAIQWETIYNSPHLKLLTGIAQENTSFHDQGERVFVLYTNGQKITLPLKITKKEFIGLHRAYFRASKAIAK